MLFFEVLPFTTLAVSVNSKTSQKSMQKKRGVFLVCLGPKGIDTPKKTPRFFFCMLFFEVLPFTTLAVSVTSKTSKKSMQKKNAAFF